jgi:hypothetical protein
MMDPRRKKVLSVLVIGLAILAWRIYVIFADDLPSRTQAGLVPAPAKVEELVEDLARRQRDIRLSLLLEGQQKTLDLPWGRDPFVPPFVEITTPDPTATTKVPIIVGEAPPAPNLRFSGVSRSGDRWLAAVDGFVLGVGDSIHDGFTVRRITRNSILLECRGWGFQYSLGSSAPMVRPIPEVP